MHFMNQTYTELECRYMDQTHELECCCMDILNKNTAIWSKHIWWVRIPLYRHTELENRYMTQTYTELKCRCMEVLS